LTCSFESGQAGEAMLFGVGGQCDIDEGSSDNVIYNFGMNSMQRKPEDLCRSFTAGLNSHPGNFGIFASIQLLGDAEN
jgi:hypothetical protein